MSDIYIDLFQKLDKYTTTNPNVLSWGSPILYFGNIHNSKIATLGINPSDKEFLDDNNFEISSYKRRFHTLKSLNLSKWGDASYEHIKAIENTWTNYFINNPYDTWFKKLDFIFSNTSKSYYFPSLEVCHLDLVPFATIRKWGDLKKSEQDFLINDSLPFLCNVLVSSNIEYLILNGRSVIDNFQKASGITLQSYPFNQIDIIRKFPYEPIRGVCFEGEINTFAGTKLSKNIKIIGYNHNLQSSFGVSNDILKSLRTWISNKILL